MFSRNTSRSSSGSPSGQTVASPTVVAKRERGNQQEELASGHGGPVDQRKCSGCTYNGEGWILIGKEQSGWSIFQGNCDSTDRDLFHTAAREGAEEGLEAFGSCEEIMARFFPGSVMQ